MQATWYRGECADNLRDDQDPPVHQRQSRSPRRHAAVRRAAVRQDSRRRLPAGDRRGNAPALEGGRRHRRSDGAADLRQHDRRARALRRAAHARAQGLWRRHRREHQRPSCSSPERRSAQARRAHRRDLSRTRSSFSACRRSTISATSSSCRRSRTISSSAITWISCAPARACRTTDKARLRALNQEESTLTTDFQNQLLAATKAGALVVDDSTRLDGLSDADVAAAAEAARERGLAGNWVLTLQNTTQQPPQESLRVATCAASCSRRRHTAPIAATPMTRAASFNASRVLRAERAKLLGYSTAADYILDDQMAKTPAAAIKLLTEIGAPAIEKARSEARKMQSAHRRGARRLRARAVGLAVLRRARAKGRVRSRRVADQAVLRARSRAARRRVLRGDATVRHHVQGAETTFRSTIPTFASSRCSTPTARRSRCSTPTTSSATTRAAARGWIASSTNRDCSARSPSCSTLRTSPSRRRDSRRC